MTRLYPLLPWALCVLGAVCCLSACVEPVECKRECERAGLVVSRAGEGHCNCADPRAPAYVDNSVHTTTYAAPVSR